MTEDDVVREKVYGFEPVYDHQSKILILGSFPSVKSRQIEFYYGNKQNRFWKMLSGYFMAPMPESTDDKKQLVLGHAIALWDIVTSCEIKGSADDSIENYTVADVPKVIKEAPIELILLNGKKAFTIFEENYKNCGVKYLLMPSTSPANPRFNAEIWRQALDSVYNNS